MIRRRGERSLTPAKLCPARIDDDVSLRSRSSQNETAGDSRTSPATVRNAEVPGLIRIGSHHPKPLAHHSLIS